MRGISDLASAIGGTVGTIANMGKKVNSEYWNNLPAIEIVIDSKKMKFIDGAKVVKVISEVSVSSEASQIIFEISIPHAFENGKLRCEEMVSKLKLGSNISIKMGYKIIDSKFDMYKVFKGFIACVDVDYNSSGNARVIVTAMDAKVYMMNSCQTKQYKTKDYSQVVNKVISNHDRRLSGKSVSITSGKKSYGDIFQYEQTDYEFLKNIAKVTGSLFFISLGKLYFVSPTKTKKTHEINASSGIITSISRKLNMLGISNQTKYFSASEQNPNKVLEASTKSSVTIGQGKSPTASIKNLSGCDDKKIYNGVGSMQELKNYAQAQQFGREWNFNSVQVKTCAMVNIEAGDTVLIKGFGNIFNNTYMVYSVKHVFQNGKIFTDLVLKATRA